MRADPSSCPFEQLVKHSFLLCWIVVHEMVLYRPGHQVCIEARPLLGADMLAQHAWEDVYRGRDLRLCMQAVPVADSERKRNPFQSVVS